MLYIGFCTRSVSRRSIWPVLRHSRWLSGRSHEANGLFKLGRVITDDFAKLRDSYNVPKHPIVLAHGLLGFDELKVTGNFLPGIQYWRGIRESMFEKGIKVITATVPPSGSIQDRAKKLAEQIEEKAEGKAVNIIAGLDSRYMISNLKPLRFGVKSLTTISTPHRGSAFADYVFDRIGPIYIPQMYKALESFGLETGAFSQLTTGYMQEKFNPETPDCQKVRYFSYGATLEPTYWSLFKLSHQVILELEKSPNDGLVSAKSSHWGTYKGTLTGVSHLDLINWTNRMKRLFWYLTGTTHNFNAIAFYLHIADMLAKEKL